MNNFIGLKWQLISSNVSEFSLRVCVHVHGSQQHLGLVSSDSTFNSFGPSSWFFVAFGFVLFFLFNCLGFAY